MLVCFAVAVVHAEPWSTRPVEGLGPTLHKQGGTMELHKQEEKVTHIKQLQQSIQEYAKLSPTTEALGS